MFVLFLLPPFSSTRASSRSGAAARRRQHPRRDRVPRPALRRSASPNTPTPVVWQPLYDLIYAVDLRSNAVPSFHVIYTASILLALMAVATPRLRFSMRSGSRRLRLDRAHSSPSSARRRRRHRHRARGMAAASPERCIALDTILLHWSSPMKSIASAVAVLLLTIDSRDRAGEPTGG